MSYCVTEQINLQHQAGYKGEQVLLRNIWLPFESPFPILFLLYEYTLTSSSECYSFFNVPAAINYNIVMKKSISWVKMGTSDGKT